MRRAVVAVVLALAAAAAAFGQTNVEGAQKELDAGAQAYRDGRFAEAEQHFRRALELDPEGKNTRFFIARSVQQQYKPDDTSPENAAVGERAAAAYQEILAKDPANEDAYKAAVFLYTQMKNEQKVNELLLARANDFSFPEGQRAEAFTTLATKQWQCSYEVTERKENKTTETKPPDNAENKPAGNKQEKAVTKYKMPADQGDFIRARQCVNEGLQLAEQAVGLSPKSTSAWAYKAKLLNEAAKLAEMEGDAAGHDEYVRQHEEAVARQKQLMQEEKQAKQSEGQAGTATTSTTASPKTAATPKRPPMVGAVLNGKATSKPTPVYPPEAKAAGVQGTVVVFVTVDEAGKVVEAEAISGPPPLRDAAVAAARRALLTPTLLSGQPVKYKGVLTYQFVLPK